MNLQTVSVISKKYGVSTRMLRYYEQCGLIASQRKDGYSFRVYDELNTKRLQQVIILRKLQIPIKQIYIIINNPDAATVVDVFQKNIHELDSEITALSTIRNILFSFISELETTANVNLSLSFLNGDAVLETVDSLSLIQKNTKEKMTMTDLDQAADVLSKTHNVKVRVYLFFNGNCAQAIALYEKAFGINAEFILRYKDVPPEDGSKHPDGTEDFVMNAWLKLGNDEIGTIGMCDRLPDTRCVYGDGVAVHVSLGSADAVRTAFSILKDGGEISVSPEKVFYSECYCEVTDKFGIKWILMYN